MKSQFTILILLFPLLMAAQVAHDEYTNLLWGIHAGGNYTCYKSDSIDYNASLMPAVGINVSKRIIKNFELTGGIQYSMKGSSSVSPSVHIRKNYAETWITGAYKTKEGLKLEAGICYPYLTNSYRFTLDTSGVVKVPLQKTNNRTEFVAGAEIPLNDDFRFMVRFHAPLDKTQKFQVQAYLCINLNRRKVVSKQKEVFSLPAKNENPLLISSVKMNNKVLSEIPAEVFEMLNLEKLELESNNITSIPESFARLVNLSALKLSGNNLTEIGSSVFALYNLEELDLSNNKIQQVSNEIVQLKKLKILNLSGNPIAEIPSQVFEMEALEKLIIGKNTKLPEGISTKKINIIQK